MSSTRAQSDFTTTAVMVAAVVVAALAGGAAVATVTSRVARPTANPAEVRRIAEQAFETGRRVERNQRAN